MPGPNNNPYRFYKSWVFFSTDLKSISALNRNRFRQLTLISYAWIHLFDVQVYFLGDSRDKGGGGGRSEHEIWNLILLVFGEKIFGHNCLLTTLKITKGPNELSVRLARRNLAVKGSIPSGYLMPLMIRCMVLLGMTLAEGLFNLTMKLFSRRRWRLVSAQKLEQILLLAIMNCLQYCHVSSFNQSQCFI